MNRLLSNLRDVLEANIEGQSLHVSKVDLNAGATLNKAISDQVKSLQKTMSLTSDEKRIAFVLANLAGYRANWYPSQLALDITVNDIIEEYRVPIKISIEIIKKLICHHVEDMCKDVLDTYPKLHKEVLYVINSNINKFEEDTKNHLMTHIDAQQSFMNLEHEEFIRAVNFEKDDNDENDDVVNDIDVREANKLPPTRRPPPIPPKSMRRLSGSAPDLTAITSLDTSKRAKSSTNLSDAPRNLNPKAMNGRQIVSMVKAYMNIVNKTILDMIPKYIVLKMIRGVSLNTISISNLK